MPTSRKRERRILQGLMDYADRGMQSLAGIAAPLAFRWRPWPKSLKTKHNPRCPKPLLFTDSNSRLSCRAWKARSRITQFIRGELNHGRTGQTRWRQKAVLAAHRRRFRRGNRDRFRRGAFAGAGRDRSPSRDGADDQSLGGRNDRRALRSCRTSYALTSTGRRFRPVLLDGHFVSPWALGFIGNKGLTSFFPTYSCAETCEMVI